jgi:hypothetical protein
VALEEDQAAADAEGDGFRAAGGAELAENGSDVKLDGVLGDAELGGDFLVAEAAGEHLEDFAFARREGLDEFVQGTRRHRSGGHGGMDVCGMQHHEPAGDGLQGGGELVGRSIVGQDRANSRTKRLCGSNGRRGFGKQDDVEVRCQARGDDGIQERLE